MKKANNFIFELYSKNILDTNYFFARVVAMKTLLTIIVMVMLFATSVATAAQACCANDMSTDSSHLAQVTDGSDGQSDNAGFGADCGCLHHGHSTMTLASASLDEQITNSQIIYKFGNEVYHSQLLSIISKPPKA